MKQEILQGTSSEKQNTVSGKPDIFSRTYLFHFFFFWWRAEKGVAVANLRFQISFLSNI